MNSFHEFAELDSTALGEMTESTSFSWTPIESFSRRQLHKMTNTNTTLHFLQLNLQTYNEMDSGLAYESNVGQKKIWLQ